MLNENKYMQNTHFFQFALNLALSKGDSKTGVFL